jgi:hypothetical protein
MDLRSLDPFVNNPPGRAGNLYDTFGGLMTGIDETPMLFNELPSETQCAVASTGGTNLCFQNHTILKKEIIPKREIQFDPNIEDLRQYQSPVPVMTQPVQVTANDPSKFVVPFIIMFLILIFV